MGNREVENGFQNVSSSSMQCNLHTCPAMFQAAAIKRTFAKGHCDVFRGLLLSPRLFSTHTPEEYRSYHTSSTNTQNSSVQSPELHSLRPTSPLCCKPRFHILSLRPHAQIPAPPQAFLCGSRSLTLEAHPLPQPVRLALWSRNPLRPITRPRPRDPPPPPPMAHHGVQVRRARPLVLSNLPPFRPETPENAPHRRPRARRGYLLCQPHSPPPPAGRQAAERAPPGKSRGSIPTHLHEEQHLLPPASPPPVFDPPDPDRSPAGLRGRLPPPLPATKA